MANTIFDIPYASWSDSLYGNYIMVHDLGQPEASATRKLSISGLFNGSISPNNRTTQDNSGIISIDWNNRLLYNYNNHYVINWGNKWLMDDAAAICADWGARTLNQSNGNNPSLNWQDLILNDVAGYYSLRWGARELYDNIGHLSLNWENRYVLDTSGILSIDWKNRRLHKSDGSIALDWNVKVKSCLSTVFTISQNSTDAPVIASLLTDEIGIFSGVYTLVRNATGVYTISYNLSTLNWTKFIGYAFNNAKRGQLSVNSGNMDTTIHTYDAAGVISDDCLVQSIVKIEYYG